MDTKDKTTPEELLKIRKHLIKSNAPDVAFEAMDLAVPTQEERDSFDTPEPDINEIKRELIDSLFKKLAPQLPKSPRIVNDIHMGFFGGWGSSRV